MTKKNSTETKTQDEKTVIYCGPNIKNTLKQFAVFQEPLPSVITELIQKQPLIGKLTVPVPELAKTRAAVSTPGTPENIWYNKILTGGDA